MDYTQFTFNYPDCIIKHTRNTYERTSSGKAWKTNPTETKTKIVTCEFYTNFVQSVPFFSHWGTCRAYSDYTTFGYIPHRIVSICPMKETKHVDSFSFIYFPRSRALRDAGFREKDVLENVSHFDISIAGERKIYNFYHKDGEHSASYDITNHKWVN